MAEPKMYIFINSDLNMSSGKIASQACHVTHRIIEELVRNGYEHFPTSNEYLTFMKWNKNCTKIVLKATHEQLLELLQLPNSRGFYDNYNMIQNCLTAIGFFPSSDINDFTSKYKLL